MVSILLVLKFTLTYKYNGIPCIAPGQHRNPCPVLEWPSLPVVSVGSKACKEGKQTQLGPLADFVWHCPVYWLVNEFVLQLPDLTSVVIALSLFLL